MHGHRKGVIPLFGPPILGRAVGASRLNNIFVPALHYCLERDTVREYATLIRPNDPPLIPDPMSSKTRTSPQQAAPLTGITGPKRVACIHRQSEDSN